MTEYHDDEFRRDRDRMERNFNMAWWGITLFLFSIALLTTCN